MKSIVVHQARRHNLKSIDVFFPYNALSVVTGVSGSGKSSLAFDVLFQAGRQAYLQAIGMLGELSDDPGYERIDGLRPTIAVKQGITRQSNPRSVVGTRTGSLSLLAALFADYHNQLHVDKPPKRSAHFLFNSPQGMCLHCKGRGFEFELDMDLLLPTATTSLSELYDNAQLSSLNKSRIKRIARQFDFSLDTPFLELDEAVQRLVLYGQHPTGAVQSGLEEQLQYLFARGRENSGVLKTGVCRECSGCRVSDAARAIKLNRKHIGELALMNVAELSVFLRDASLATLSQNVLEQLLVQLEQLIEVKLEYLTLYRPMPTLSGGELQRLLLMSHLSTQLHSTVFVFDEPTASLHEIEKQQLIEKLRALLTFDNTLVVVEHDSMSIQAADHVVDIGPLAGGEGGHLMYQGPVAGLLAQSQSITTQYLTGARTIGNKPHSRVSECNHPMLSLKNVCTNNLQSVSVDIPMQCLVGIAGVSGSGKSSLIADTLVPGVQSYLQSQTSVNVAPRRDARKEADEEDNATVFFTRPRPVFDSIEVPPLIDRCIEVNQQPIGRRSNSTPASYLGIWSRIRKRFSELPLSLERGYTAGHFSFNSVGACSHCKGIGEHQMRLGGAQVRYPCENCAGQRYEQKILDVRLQGNSISDILGLSVTEALTVFSNDKPISRMLSILDRTGMGYITLGQPTSTLSGGEAQRLKIAKEISSKSVRRDSGQAKSLFVLDEPTTGLSAHDVARLFDLLVELVDLGHSVVVVEHDSQLLSKCAWLLEIGPGSGTQGGQVIASGTPQQLKQHSESLIGDYLLAADSGRNEEADAIS